MNFLQIINRVRTNCGVSGPALTTAQNLSGESLNIANWTNEAWLDIQAQRTNWEWMRKTATFSTVTSQPQYTIAQIGLTDFGAWARDTFRNYDTSVGLSSEIFMEYIDYDAWRDGYEFGALRQTQTRPTVITIGPDKSIGLGPFPISGYTVLGDYYSVPTEMAADADIPDLPTQFHLAIVYRAMMAYGQYESAPEVYNRGAVEFDKWMRRVYADRLPEVVVPGALC